MSRALALACLWLLSILPMPWLRLKGAVLGELLYALMASRRRTGLRNLALCFPEWPAHERRRVLRRHFRLLATTMLCYGKLYFASPAALKKLVRVENAGEFESLVGQQPIILLVAHFIGLDPGGVRYTLEHPGIILFSSPRGVFNRIVRELRERFGRTTAIRRGDSVRPILKALKQNIPLYYLPDQDLGPRESIFAPFFGIPTATVPALHRLAQMSGARVIPMITRLEGNQFVTRYLPAWDDFPGADALTDTTRMNAFIEAQIRQDPAQYWWLHRRFKTRPEGEPGLY